MIVVAGFIVLGAIMMLFTRRLQRNNRLKIFAYVFVVGFTAAMNNTLCKVLTIATGSMWYLMLGLFVMGSILSGCAGAIACTVLNTSTSLPLISCTQVLANGLSGICIWGDLDRLVTPEAYLFVYVYFILGVYLCSAYDFLQDFTRWQLLSGEEDFHMHRCSSKYGDSMDKLFSAIVDAHKEQAQPGELARCFKEYLALCKANHTLDAHLFEGLSIHSIGLTSKYGGEDELARVLSRWLAEHDADYQYVMQRHPEFAAVVHGISGLPDSGDESASSREEDEKSYRALPTTPH
jgi:hypothetical protein